MLKMTLPSTPPEAAQALRKEVALATWAGGQGLGPEVIAFDAERGFWMCRYVQSSFNWWEQASVEPKLSAILLTARSLHALTRHNAPSKVEHPVDTKAALREVASLDARDAADS